MDRKRKEEFNKENFQILKFTKTRDHREENSKQKDGRQTNTDNFEALQGTWIT